MTELPPDIRHRLALHGQAHILLGWDGLSPGERAEFVQQLAGIDFAELESLYRRKDDPAAAVPDRSRIRPIPVTPAAPVSPDDTRAGQDALRRGEVAALLVAGGQGTRLGFDKPKGMFPVGPVSGATLFQIHAEKVLATSRRYGRPVPFLVMTSSATHDDTVAFFRDNRFFGLSESQVSFFQQGTMPALDLATGGLLLEKPGSLFLSPNGHGGTLTALAESGLLAELRQQGVRHVFYFQVDNPLVKVCDPTFLGQHVRAESEASSKVVFKTQPGEKVGVLALVDGRCSIVEYSDMPKEMAEERAADGSLAYRAGNPAIHAFSLDFLDRITAKGGGLEYHVARKKVPFFDPAAGQTVTPARENALKFERFIFDALPLAARWLAVETPREDEFAPVKNATGADSADSSRALMVAQAGRWLGVGEPPHPVEVSPLFALDADECRAKRTEGFSITGPTYLKQNHRSADFADDTD